MFKARPALPQATQRRLLLDVGNTAEMLLVEGTDWGHSALDRRRREKTTGAMWIIISGPLGYKTVALTNSSPPLPTCVSSYGTYFTLVLKSQFVQQLGGYILK